MPRPDPHGALSALVPPSGPARRLAAATLVNTLGNGIFLAGGVIFMTRSLGLSAGRVGLALTIGGLLALLAGPVAGDLADRLGARQVTVAALVVEALATVLLVLAHGFGLLVVAVVLAEVGTQSSRSGRGALIALIGGPDGAVRFRAQLRALTNVGISVGALLGGAALAVDTRAGYVAMILVDGATFVVAALMVAGLPAYRPTRRRDDGARRWLALADRPYLAVTALNAVMCLNYGILTVGVPLWVTTHTRVPRPVVALLLLVNTVCIVALQVRASRAVVDPRAGALALRRAGLAFVAGWTLLGLASGLAVAPAVALLLAGVALHTVGELWQAAASFELSFSLALPRAQGQYQGVFGVGQSLADALAPVVAATVCVAGGLAGWIGLGLAVALAGAAAPAAVAWAGRATAAVA